MGLILFIGFLLVVLTVFMLSRRPPRPLPAPTRLKPAPPYPGGLFSADAVPERVDEASEAAVEPAELSEKDRALAFIESWREAPARESVAELLARAARAGDAEIYQQAVVAALDAWRGGGLPQVSATQLRALIESHYWLLGPEARGSGAGYLLKRMLAEARRELAAGERRAST